MRTPSILAALLLGSAALTSCGGGDGGGGPNPTPGSLDVVLTAAPTAPGAIMFTVSGGPITGITVAGFTKYESTTAANSRTVLLTGNIIAGTLVQIQVPDVAKVNNYVVNVLQVAARSNAAVPYAQLGVGGYPVDVQ